MSAVLRLSVKKKKLLQLPDFTIHSQTRKVCPNCFVRSKVKTRWLWAVTSHVQSWTLPSRSSTSCWNMGQPWRRRRQHQQHSFFYFPFLLQFITNDLWRFHGWAPSLGPVDFIKGFSFSFFCSAVVSLFKGSVVCESQASPELIFIV